MPRPRESRFGFAYTSPRSPNGDLRTKQRAFNKRVVSMPTFSFQKELAIVSKQEPVKAETASYRIGQAVIIQEFDEAGNHRIRWSSRMSRWVGYQSFAIIQLAGGDSMYVGCTDYYSGEFPPVFRIEKGKKL